MAAFSVVFVMATGLFYRLGFQDVSLIYANIVNLLSRIVFAAHFIAAHYNRKGAASIVRWTSLLPHWSFIGLSVTSAIALNTLPLDVTLVRRGGFKALLHTSVLTYVGVGALLAISTGSIWWAQTGRHLVLPRRTRP
jgi:oligosaccharide translocation protein RFT1